MEHKCFYLKELGQTMVFIVERRLIKIPPFLSDVLVISALERSNKITIAIFDVVFMFVCMTLWF